MAKKRNIIVGQSGGPTSVINSSLAGVYKNAVERGFDKVYGMLHGIQGLLDEQYIDLSTQIHSELDIELLKRTRLHFLVPAVISFRKSMKTELSMRKSLIF
mgnify:FL=1